MDTGPSVDIPVPLLERYIVGNIYSQVESVFNLFDSKISFVSWPKLFIGREWKFWFNLRTDFTNNRHMYGVSLASPLKLS